MTSKWLTLILAAVPIPAQVPSYLQKEAALGAFLSSDFEKHATPLDVPEVTAYLDLLSGQIASQLPEFKLPFTIHVVLDRPFDLPAQEPIWIPGGHIFLSTRFIISAQNEAQFTRTLAHSMAHIALHHGFRMGTDTAPLIFLGAATPNMLPMKYRPVWEANEREADAAAERIQGLEDADGTFGRIQERLRELFPPPAKPSLLTR